MLFQILVLLLLHKSSFAFELRGADKFLSTTFMSTLESSPGFVAAMIRLQHMKWSTVLKRLPEFVTLSVYLKEIGVDVDHIASSFRNVEDKFDLEKYGEPHASVLPTFQPLIEKIFSDVPRSVLIETLAATFAKEPKMEQICSRINGNYIKTLLDMIKNQHYGKRMMIEFLNMDLNLEEVVEFFVEIVSVACVNIQISKLGDDQSIILDMVSIV